MPHPTSRMDADPCRSMDELVPRLCAGEVPEGDLSMDVWWARV